VQPNLGNSTRTSGGTPAQMQYGVYLPAIPEGVPTTVIPVHFRIVQNPDGPQEQIIRDGELAALFLVAIVVWMVPWMLVNSRICCRCCRRCVSRRLGCYFFIGLLVNIGVLAIFIRLLPGVSANMVFFKIVAILEFISDKLQDLLMQIGAICGLFVAFSFRKRVLDLLGYDSQLLKIDLKDVMTCFSMKRYRTIEVAVLQALDLTPSYSSRSLYLRVVLGCNEPRHSRARDNVWSDLRLKERMLLNFDPADETQILSVIIKEQEVIGSAVAQLAPAAGAIAGAVTGLVGPLGPQGGAALGAIAGVGTANSLGPEVGRIDLPVSRINALRERAAAKSQEIRWQTGPMSTGPSVPWADEYFEEVDLLPQGKLWLRIMDVETA